MTLWKVAAEPSRRLTRIFLADDQSSRRVKAWYAQRRDPVLFCEYFYSDGSGVGASPQTGWTRVVAKLLQQSAEGDSSTARPEEQEVLAEVSA